MRYPLRTKKTGTPAQPTSSGQVVRAVWYPRTSRAATARSPSSAGSSRPCTLPAAAGPTRVAAISALRRDAAHPPGVASELGQHLDDAVARGDVEPGHREPVAGQVVAGHAGVVVARRASGRRGGVVEVAPGVAEAGH